MLFTKKKTTFNTYIIRTFYQTRKVDITFNLNDFDQH